MSDNIVFNNIPIDARTPGVYFEVDASRAVTALPGMPRRLLILGDALTSSPTIDLVPTRILTADHGDQLYGAASPLAGMVRAARAHNTSTELWAMALPLVGDVQPSLTLGLLSEPVDYGALDVYNEWNWIVELQGPFDGSPSTTITKPGAGVSRPAVFSDFVACADLIAATLNQDLGQYLTATAFNDTVRVRAKAPYGASLQMRMGPNTNSPNVLVGTQISTRFTSEFVAFTDDVAGGGSSAIGSIAVDVTGLKAGTLPLYVAGRRYAIDVRASDTAMEIAERIEAAINRDAYAPVSASAGASTVNLTAKWSGVTGNQCDLRAGYYAGESVPVGLTLTFTALSGGVGVPDVTAALAALGDTVFTGIVSPWTDASTMATIEGWLEERFLPMDPKAGHLYTAQSASLATLQSQGQSRNSKQSTILGLYRAPEPAYLWAASLAAICEYEAAQDPARPLQQVRIKRLPPALGDRFTRDEREALLRSGISTFTVGADGNAYLERIITTYAVNNLGLPDVSWLDLEPKQTVVYLRYAICARLAEKFSRMKLADDGAKISPGQPIVTPSVVRAELIALCYELQAAGLVENVDQFKRDILVLRSQVDRTRVNVVLPPDIINQLRVIAGTVQFRL